MGLSHSLCDVYVARTLIWILLQVLGHNRDKIRIQQQRDAAQNAKEI